MAGLQMFGQQSQDQRIRRRLAGEREEMRGGGDGAGQDGGSLVRRDAGEFGAQAAAGVARGNDDQAIAQIERALVAGKRPLAGQDFHCGG